MNEENMGANEGRNGEVKERVISFRLNPQEYTMVEGIAGLAGEAPNAWARKIVLDEARGEEGLSRKEPGLGKQLPADGPPAGGGDAARRNRRASAPGWSK